MPIFDIIAIDPPWPKKKGGIRKVRPRQGRALGYSTLCVGDIFRLLDNEIFPLAAQTHTVFLWNIDQFLHIGEEEMLSRGYRLHARMIWDKGNGVAPAFSVRYTHEYLLWFYKPKFTPIAPNMRGRVATVFAENSREHSRKPDIAYSIIGQWYPLAAKLDVFSRENREGWLQWGDQIDWFATA